MKTTTYYIALLIVALILIDSNDEYKQEVEEHRIEQDLKREETAEAHADSLGLTGQDRIDFINNY